ncbi:beta-defensin 133 [Otolemur garnettii]|uniref:beta-defensin 133 n=1 Tax=Otolemur garnettii TaxID=30611 RepID=UPI000C7F217E|nr:beta-defensin 133 [Otolemur garnettii]
MKIPVFLFFLFFFLDPMSPVKCAMKDTISCFVLKGKCKRVCNNLERSVGHCTKLNVNCCLV